MINILDFEMPPETDLYPLTKNIDIFYEQKNGAFWNDLGAKPYYVFNIGEDFGNLKTPTKDLAPIYQYCIHTGNNCCQTCKGKSVKYALIKWLPFPTLTKIDISNKIAAFWKFYSYYGENGTILEIIIVQKIIDSTGAISAIKYKKWLTAMWSYFHLFDYLTKK